MSAACEMRGRHAGRVTAARSCLSVPTCIRPVADAVVVVDLASSGTSAAPRPPSAVVASEGRAAWPAKKSWAIYLLQARRGPWRPLAVHALWVRRLAGRGAGVIAHRAVVPRGTRVLPLVRSLRLAPCGGCGPCGAAHRRVGGDLAARRSLSHCLSLFCCLVRLFLFAVNPCPPSPVGSPARPQPQRASSLTRTRAGGATTMCPSRLF